MTVLVEKPTLNLHQITQAIEDIRMGKMVIVVDDKDRENEGDFVAAAQRVTPEMINFMATHGRGLICVPLTEKRCRELQLKKMVLNSTDPMETAFTVSVDLRNEKVSSGISTADRALTIKALVDPDTRPRDLNRPGHIFPLIAKDGGVLRRTGHTEAAIDLARLAGFDAAGVIVEIMNADGTMARLPQLIEVAKKFDLKIISIEDLVAYRMRHDGLIELRDEFNINTRFGQFNLKAFEQTNNKQLHLALTRGNWELGEPVLTRINSTQLYSDILGNLTHNAGGELERMFGLINKEEKGAVIFVNQQKPYLNLQRLSALKKLQKRGTLRAPKIVMDSKDYGIGAQILHELGISKIRLMSNSKQTKRVGMIGYGLEIIEYVNY